MRRSIAFFLQHEQVHQMLLQIAQFLDQWLDPLSNDNRSYVTVAIGCTGGQHRSVYLVEELTRLFADRWTTLSRHRELDATPGRYPVHLLRLASGLKQHAPHRRRQAQLRPRMVAPNHSPSASDKRVLRQLDAHRMQVQVLVGQHMLEHRLLQRRAVRLRHLFLQRLAAVEPGQAMQPAQTPGDGRRCSQTASRSQRAHNNQTDCALRLSLARAHRISPAACPVHGPRIRAAPGQRSHAGWRGRHTVAPRSIMPCV
jgi:hypothetical protein